VVKNPKIFPSKIVDPKIVSPKIIGLISDTHGLLREEAVRALRGSQLIIHAGDVGGPEILDTLRELAPVVAVRGNVDRGEWAFKLPLTAVAELGSAKIYVLHDVHQLDLNPVAVGFQAVVSGHSHKFANIERDGVMYINPGAAGPRRFRLPVTVARLNVGVTPWTLDFVDLGYVP
jgi:putative phosphoesterase